MDSWHAINLAFTISNKVSNYSVDSRLIDLTSAVPVVWDQTSPKWLMLHDLMNTLAKEQNMHVKNFIVILPNFTYWERMLGSVS